MTRMLLRRLGLAIPTLLGVSVVIFLLMSVLPGDLLAGLLAQDATAADRAALTHSLGLDAPLACATSGGSGTSCTATSATRRTASAMSLSCSAPRS